jgi:putative two-component system response regulator
VALADVYDALTSERVYKKAYSHEKALDMIANGESGTFNPDLIKEFLNHSAEIKEAMCTQLNRCQDA